MFELTPFIFFYTILHIDFYELNPISFYAIYALFFRAQFRESVRSRRTHSSLVQHRQRILSHGSHLAVLQPVPNQYYFRMVHSAVHSAKLGSTTADAAPSSVLAEKLAEDLACVIGVSPDIAVAIGAAGGTAVLVGVALISLIVRYIWPCGKGKSIVCKRESTLCY